MTTESHRNPNNDAAGLFGFGHEPQCGKAAASNCVAVITPYG